MKLSQYEAIALLVQRQSKQRFKGITEGTSMGGMVSPSKPTEIGSQLNENRLQGASK
jgi:hypothetical protein